MVSIVNTGEGSAQYHISSATTAPPKIQTRMVMKFAGVARANVLQDGWWLMFWRLGFMGSPINTPDKFYNDLLPLLLDKPLDAAILENNCHNDDILCPFRTNQRASVTGYRCVREAWVYFLNRHGITPQHSLQVRYHMILAPACPKGITHQAPLLSCV